MGKHVCCSRLMPHQALCSSGPPAGRSKVPACCRQHARRDQRQLSFSLDPTLVFHQIALLCQRVLQAPSPIDQLQPYPIAVAVSLHDLLTLCPLLGRCQRTQGTCGRWMEPSTEMFCLHLHLVLNLSPAASGKSSRSRSVSWLPAGRAGSPLSACGPVARSERWAAQLALARRAPAAGEWRGSSVSCAGQQSPLLGLSLLRLPNAGSGSGGSSKWQARRAGPLPAATEQRAA